MASFLASVAGITDRNEMTRFALSHRDRRVLTGGCIVLALVIVLGRGLPALLRWRADLDASALELTGEQVRAERSIRSRPAMRDSLAVRRRQLALLDSAFLIGDTPASAGAMLAEVVAESAAATNATLGIVQLRGDTAVRGPYTPIAVRVGVSGTLESIALFLASLEEGPTLLAVRELTLTQPEPGIAPTRIETMRAEVLVEGLARNLRPGSVR
jgi:hypothetical protein